MVLTDRCRYSATCAGSSIPNLIKANILTSIGRAPFLSSVIWASSFISTLNASIKFRTGPWTPYQMQHKFFRSSLTPRLYKIAFSVFVLPDRYFFPDSCQDSFSTLLTKEVFPWRDCIMYRSLITLVSFNKLFTFASNSFAFLISLDLELSIMRSIRLRPGKRAPRTRQP